MAEDEHSAEPGTSEPTDGLPGSEAVWGDAPEPSPPLRQATPPRPPRPEARGPEAPRPQPVPPRLQPQVVQQTAPAPRSVALAAVLGFFFGPLGMLYSTLVGAVVMFVVCTIVGFVTFGFGLVAMWPLCAIWAAMSASAANNRLRA